MVEIGPVVLEKKIFILSPLGKKLSSSFEKKTTTKKQKHFRHTKNALCQLWLKLALWFWRKRFLNFVGVFLLFRNYLPLTNGVVNIVLREYNVTFLCHYWFLYILWWGCWYANMDPSEKTLILKWPLKPEGLMCVITSSGWIDRWFYTERDHVVKSTSES